MSLNKKNELAAIAKVVCRGLRNNPTETEKIFWEAVRNKRFEGKKFYRQHPFFYDLTGRETFFIADFYCYEEKLIIELDGIYHKYRLKQDEERTKIFNLLGVRMIRFTNNEIKEDINSVLKKIKNLFR